MTNMTNFRSVADILLLLGCVLGHLSCLTPARPPESSKHGRTSHPLLEAYRGPEVLDVTRRVEGAFCELRLERGCLRSLASPKPKASWSYTTYGDASESYGA
jgi:hypothetical protein